MQHLRRHPRPRRRPRVHRLHLAVDVGLRPGARDPQHHRTAARLHPVHPVRQPAEPLDARDRAHPRSRECPGSPAAPRAPSAPPGFSRPSDLTMLARHPSTPRSARARALAPRRRLRRHQPRADRPQLRRLGGDLRRRDGPPRLPPPGDRAGAALPPPARRLHPDPRRRRRHRPGRRMAQDRRLPRRRGARHLAGHAGDRRAQARLRPPALRRPRRPAALPGRPLRRRRSAPASSPPATSAPKASTS